MSCNSQSDSFLCLYHNIEQILCPISANQNLAYVLVITLNRFHVPWHWGKATVRVCDLRDVSLWVRVCKSESTSLSASELTKNASSWLATYNLQTCVLQLAGLWRATCTIVVPTFSDLSHCDIQPHLEVLMLCQLVRKYVPSKRRRRRRRSCWREKSFVDERMNLTWKSEMSGWLFVIYFLCHLWVCTAY